MYPLCSRLTPLVLQNAYYWSLLETSESVFLVYSNIE